MKFLRYLFPILDKAITTIDPLSTLGFAAMGLGAGGLIGGGIFNALRKPKKAKSYSIADTGEGQEVIRRLMTQLKDPTGGVSQTGFGDDFVNRISSPGIAQREAGFREREVPFLSSQASGRGLGRSDLAVKNILGPAFQQKERDIASMIGQAQLQNLQQGKLDEQRRFNNIRSTQNALTGIAQNMASGGTNQSIMDAQASQQQQSNMQNVIQAGLGAFTGGIDAMTPETSLIDLLRGNDAQDRNIFMSLPDADLNLDPDELVKKYPNLFGGE